MKTVIIDNYDSFTYNLAHLVKELGAEVDVLRNDKFELEELEKYDKIILSPGPGIPEEAGLLLEVIRTYAGRKPMLGVCLGEQAIGQAFGGKLTNLSEVFHGIQTNVKIKNKDYIFDGLPTEIPVGRYHSWVVDADGFPEELVVTAISPEGQIMALKHREYDVHGIRFTNDPDKLKRSMDKCNIAYLHAQLFNPAMKFVGPVRKALGVRTLFNLLGPLVNPCKPTYQLLGVADLAQMRLYTNVFYKLGIDFAVVNSLDSYDEISLTDEFKVMTRNYERIYRPQALGFSAAQPEELFGGACKEDAARIFDNILNNRATRAQTQCVIVNAAFAIQVMEPEKEIEECIAIARQSLESGRALETLKKFIEINQ